MSSLSRFARRLPAFALMSSKLPSPRFRMTWTVPFHLAVMKSTQPSLSRSPAHEPPRA